MQQDRDASIQYKSGISNTELTSCLVSLRYMYVSVEAVCDHIQQPLVWHQQLAQTMKVTTHLEMTNDPFRPSYQSELFFYESGTTFGWVYIVRGTLS